MKLTAYPKTIFCLALLLCWGNCAPPAMAQSKHYDWILITSDSAPQTVEVHTPRDSYNAVFQSEIRVFRNAEARGFLTLFPTDSAHPGGANFTFGDGHVTFNHDGTVARVLLRGYSEEGNLVVVMITPVAGGTRLIFGTDQGIWAAQGSIVVIR